MNINENLLNFNFLNLYLGENLLYAPASWEFQALYTNFGKGRGKIKSMRRKFVLNSMYNSFLHDEQKCISKFFYKLFYLIFTINNIYLIKFIINLNCTNLIN